MLSPFLPRIQLAGSNYVSSVARKTLAGNGRRRDRSDFVRVLIASKTALSYFSPPLATIFITDMEYDLSLFESSAAIMSR